MRVRRQAKLEDQLEVEAPNRNAARGPAREEERGRPFEAERAEVMEDVVKIE